MIKLSKTKNLKRKQLCMTYNLEKAPVTKHKQKRLQTKFKAKVIKILKI